MKNFYTFFNLTFFVFLFILGGLNYSLAGVNYLGSDELLDINGTPSRNSQTAGIAWNNDGSKLFVMGTNSSDDELLEYSCSTNYDVSTCTYVRELPLNNDHSGPNGPINDMHPYGFTFDDDGSHVYVSGNKTDKIYEIELGSAFDLSSASYTTEIASVDGTPCGITFNNDGTKLFLAGFAQHRIVVWTLNTPYRLTSVASSIQFSVSAESEKPRDIDFNSDGTKMYVVSGEDKHISVYSLMNAFDLSDGERVSHLGNFPVSEQDNQPFSIEFNNNGSKFYMNGYQNDSVYEYTVSTAFELINTAPTLSSSVPDDDAPGVAIDANIVLNFSENVDAESGNITIKKTSDNSTVETISVTSGQVTGSGTSQITINPSSNFDNNTEYYVLIDATAFDDVDSGSYAGISSTTDLSFTVANTIPTLSSSVPDDDAPGVAIDANIVLNFSENVDAESGNITIKKTSDNSTVETISVTSGQVTGSGTSQITINPSSNFDNNTEYYVLIDATAFDDVDSGSYAGISSTTDLSFTVANTIPTLSSSVPANNAIDVERDANIVLNFSENVDAVSGNITI
ncbi:Ig-like domain-containing protein, partial [Candidatus Pelagibacter sp.]|nr:Ig-like domain-containing protein [Candidatus Pelagibacter sp.]